LILKEKNPMLFNHDNQAVILDKPAENIEFIGRTAEDFKKAHQFIYQTWFVDEYVINKDETLSKLDNLDAKLYQLFIAQDLHGIKKIIGGLSLIDKDTPELTEFICLANAYQYELMEQLDNAIESYSYANSPNTIESSLKRIVHITLQKGEPEYAHDALKVLCEISTDYLPQLAQFYEVSQNIKEALDTYTLYLSSHPLDIPVLIKLGQLYEAQNIIDGAKFVYHQILELAPDNQVAMTALRRLS